MTTKRRKESIDNIIFDIFRKEKGSPNKCPNSVTIEMLAEATGAQTKGPLNDAGLLVKANNKNALWKAYYEITLSSIIFGQTNKTREFDFNFGENGVPTESRKIYKDFEFTIKDYPKNSTSAFDLNSEIKDNKKIGSGGESKLNKSKDNLLASNLASKKKNKQNLMSLGERKLNETMIY